jgi:hypothetical protein
MFSHYNVFVNRYDAEGKGSSMASVSAGMSPSTKSGSRSMYSDRVSLSHITKNPSLGDGKVFYHELFIINKLFFFFFFFKECFFLFYKHWSDFIYGTCSSCKTKKI